MGTRIGLRRLEVEIWTIKLFQDGTRDEKEGTCVQVKNLLLIKPHVFIPYVALVCVDLILIQPFLLEAHYFFDFEGS